MSDSTYERSFNFNASIDLTNYGELYHPQLIPVTQQKSTAKFFQHRISKNKLFDSADWVMTGELAHDAEGTNVSPSITKFNFY